MATKKGADNLMMILAAVLVIIAGATAYLLSLYGKQAPTFEQTITQMESQQESTEPETIEEDLETTDFSNLDAELSEIEKELGETSEQE